MATISGLQSPNPYSQPVSRGRELSSRPSHPGGSPSALVYHAAYSPDWMQAEHAAPPGDAVAVYGAKGELHQLSPAHASVGEPAKSEEGVVDQVTFSSDFR
ncbi:MAG: hypothetical protein KGZ83_21610 [Sulfuricella sp.]|nr:hypothetical protein [Sulfuricella sp.]